MIDIGANLADPVFAGDLDAVLARATAAGVAHMVVTGTSLAVSQRAADLAGNQPQLLSATAGIHPHDAAAAAAQPGWEQQLRQLLALPGVRAMGETGLDFNRMYSPQDVQEQVFEAQLGLAADSGLPLFLHERDSNGRLEQLLAPWRGRLGAVVVHCFTGGPEQAQRLLDLDCHLGITGWVCDERRGANLQAALPLIPDQRLMLETDAPWLLPRTIRPRPKSRRNEPAMLPWVVAEVARLRGTTPAQVAAATSSTARQFFNLPD